MIAGIFHRPQIRKMKMKNDKQFGESNSFEENCIGHVYHCHR